ncbi:MAG: stage II sporulation protein M, partial [Sphingobacteriales bacterium]
NKKEETSRFIKFWKFELPFLFYQYRRQLLYAFLFFTTFSLIGALSAKYDDTFVRLILGDSYINMTNENIAKGDPFGVYKKHGELEMFLMIAYNNIMVSFRAFASGIFLSIGPVLMMLYNGIMVGSFEYYFFSMGLGAESVLVIWIHGVLEISAIVLAGGSGLVLGSGLLFPRTYTRLEAFILTAKDASKIAIGIAPIFLVAAFFEGYITRHTDMPLWLSIGILSASSIFIIWYVIIYPRLLKRRDKAEINVQTYTYAKQHPI